jgi:hypothetical protein
MIHYAIQYDGFPVSIFKKLINSFISYNNYQEINNFREIFRENFLQNIRKNFTITKTPT